VRHSLQIALSLGAVVLTAPAFGQGTVSNTQTTSSGVVSSHQIDRYEAIQQLNNSLKTNPNNLADWVILGELAQEVATEVPADQAKGYFTLARQAYDSALKLSPENPGLKAAAQFARDQEANADQFNASRRQVTTSYLDARRREMSQSPQPTPTVRVYSGANPGGPAAASQPGQPSYPYGYPVYQPYTTPEGQPYTYQQYQNGYFPPNQTNPVGSANNTQLQQQQQQQPMTLRQYTQQLPGVLGNEAVRRIAPGAANPVGTPNPAGAGTIPPR